MMRSFVFYISVVFLAIAQAFAVVCEQDCHSAQANGCSINSNGTCLMKVGTECTQIKNNTQRSHFIPAKEGKRDWETFKSAANRERFIFSACPVIVVTPPPTTPPPSTPTPSALMCWQGGPEAGRNDCTTAGACSALNATSRTKCKDSSRNNGETYEAYYTVVCRQTSALNHPDCVINGGGVGSEDCPDSTPTCESSAYFSINGANLVCSLGNCYDSGTYTLSTYLAGGSLQGYTSETYARAEADSKTQVTNNLISSGKQPSEYNFCTTASTLNCSAPGCEGGETGDVLISWAIPKAPASCGGTTTGGSTTGGYSCTETGWAPDPAQTCSTETVAQTSNCGTTRTVTGTKSCAPVCDANTTAHCECYFMYTNPGAIETLSQGTMTSAQCEAKVGSRALGSASFYKCEWDGCNGKTFGEDPWTPPTGPTNYCDKAPSTPCSGTSDWYDCSCSGKNLMVQKRCDGSAVRQKSYLSSGCEDFGEDSPSTPVTGPAACPQSPMPTPKGYEAYQFCGCGNNPVWTKIKNASGQNLNTGC